MKRLLWFYLFCTIELYFICFANAALSQAQQGEWNIKLYPVSNPSESTIAIGEVIKIEFAGYNKDRRGMYNTQVEIFLPDVVDYYPKVKYVVNPTTSVTRNDHYVKWDNLEQHVVGLSKGDALSYYDLWWCIVHVWGVKRGTGKVTAKLSWEDKAGNKYSREYLLKTVAVKPWQIALQSLSHRSSGTLKVGEQLEVHYVGYNDKPQARVMYNTTIEMYFPDEVLPYEGKVTHGRQTVIPAPVKRRQNYIKWANLGEGQGIPRWNGWWCLVQAQSVKPTPPDKPVQIYAVMRWEDKNGKQYQRKHILKDVIVAAHQNQGPNVEFITILKSPGGARFLVDARDPEKDSIGGYRFRIDEQPWSDWMYEGLMAIDGLAAGKHTIFAQAKDDKGNEGEIAKKEFKIEEVKIVENHGPRVNISGPSYPFSNSLFIVRFELSAMDPEGDGIVGFHWKIDERPWSGWGDGIVITDSLIPGKHIIFAQAKDDKGKVGEISKKHFKITSKSYDFVVNVIDGMDPLKEDRDTKVNIQVIIENTGTNPIPLESLVFRLAPTGPRGDKNSTDSKWWRGGPVTANVAGIISSMNAQGIHKLKTSGVLVASKEYPKTRLCLAPGKVLTLDRSLSALAEQTFSREIAWEFVDKPFKISNTELYFVGPGEEIRANESTTLVSVLPFTITGLRTVHDGRVVQVLNPGGRTIYDLWNWKGTPENSVRLRSGGREVIDLPGHKSAAARETADEVTLEFKLKWKDKERIHEKSMQMIIRK